MTTQVNRKSGSSAQPQWGRPYDRAPEGAPRLYAAVVTVTGSELEMPRAGAAWTGLEGWLDSAHAPAEPTGDCAKEEADKARQCGT